MKNRARSEQMSVCLCNMMWLVSVRIKSSLTKRWVLLYCSSSNQVTQVDYFEGAHVFKQTKLKWNEKSEHELSKLVLSYHTQTTNKVERILFVCVCVRYLSLINICVNLSNLAAAAGKRLKLAICSSRSRPHKLLAQSNHMSTQQQQQHQLYWLACCCCFKVSCYYWSICLLWESKKREEIGKCGQNRQHQVWIDEQQKEKRVDEVRGWR